MHMKKFFLSLAAAFTAMSVYAVDGVAELQSISESATWNFSTDVTLSSEHAGDLQFTDEAKNVENIYANIADLTFAETFKADALAFTGEYPFRNNSKKFAQNGTLHFKTTVPGTIKVKFSDTGSSASATAVKRYLVVNDVQTEYWASRENNGEEPYSAQLNVETGEIEVAAGDVTIKGSSAICVSYVIFTAAAPSSTVDYTALNAAIAAAQDTITKGYVSANDIVATLNAAITTAQTALEATSQDDVDAAVTALNTAVTAAIEAQAAVVTPLFADGEYLIVNKETGYYLAGGLDWGTHACLSDKPQFFAASLVDGSDTYTLDSHQSNGGDNHYLGTGLYVDAPAANWTFAQTEEGYFTIANGGKFLSGNGTNAAVVLNDESSAASLWSLVTLADVVASQAEATGTSPVDVTAFINDPQFKRNGNTSGYWTITSFDGSASPSNFAQGQDGNIASCAESYHSGNGFKAVQTLSNLKAGVYALSASAFYRQDGSDNDNLPYLFAGEEKSIFPLLTGSENNMVSAYASFLAGNYVVTPIYFAVEEGANVEIGVACANTTTWNIFGQFSLLYYGQGTVAEIKAASIMSDYAAATGQVMQTTVSETMESAKATYDADPTDANMSAFSDAVVAAKASVAAYASAAEKLAAMKALVDATNLYTAEALATYYTQWAEKLAAKTLTTDEANALQDPNTVTGWRASNTVDDLIMSVWDETVENWNSYHVNTWSTEGNTDGSEFKVPFIEYWTGDDGSLGEKTLTATLNGVAAGNYAVSAWVRVRIKNGAEAPASGITFQANDGEAVNVADGAQVGTSQFYLKEVTAEGTVGEDGVLTVKFNVAADNNISWFSFKNVKFEEVVPAAEDIELTLESGKDIATELAAAIEGKKVGNITINLAEGGSYTISASIVAPASLTINGNGATVDASALAANFIEMAVVETPTEWTEANVTIKGVTVKGLAKALFYSACKNYFGDVAVDKCVVELAADATTFDYTKGSTAVNFTVTNSTFYAPTATTKSLYSSQGGQKATEYKEDATQTFTFTNNTMYNLASGKNFFTHRQSNQKWLAYTVQDNIFVNCGKSGQVIKGMNGGQNGANPTWNISGNVFNFDGADTSASEDTGDTTEGEGVQNSVAGVVTFADAANGDFNAELGVATVPAEPTVVVGDPRWTVTAAQVPVDIVISPAEGDIAAALATASEGKLVKNITINLTNDVTYTISASIVAPASLTINGNGATVDASALAANFIEMAVVETPTEWTEANVTIKGVTVKGLAKALFYSACKNYFGDVTVDKCVVELAADATTFDYTKGSTAVNFTVTNSTFYAPTATTKSLYSSQSGQKATEYKEDATQTFTFTNNTMYNLASGKNFFTHRQSNQTWLAYTVQNNIFVNCGKSGQVIKGMNGGQNGANPTWNISGNVFNFDGTDTSASEDTGDTTEGEGVQNSIAGIVTFADAAAGDFNGTFAYPFGTTAPESIGGDARWTITIAEGEDVSGIESLSVAGEQGEIFNLNGVKAVKADGMSIVNGKVVFIKK